MAGWGSVGCLHRRGVLRLKLHMSHILTHFQRGQLNNEENAPWFSIFNIIFELVSAYGTVGLSLGVGYDNFS